MDAQDTNTRLDEMLAAGGQGRLAGTFLYSKGNFGFIQQDSGDADMFVMSGGCTGFGGTFPAVGTRVWYDVVTDAKTGRPRADSVVQEGDVEVVSLQEDLQVLSEIAALEGKHSGTFQYEKGNFGFIKQDSGEADMFVMSGGCVGFSGFFPPPGTRVLYDVVTDAKTGKPRADSVTPEGGGEMAVQPGVQAVQTEGRPSGNNQVVLPRGKLTGTFSYSKGTFGFIKQDSGEADMFVMSGGCTGFGGVFPPLGTRVMYGVVTDGKTGRTRGEDVGPEDSTSVQTTQQDLRADSVNFPALATQVDASAVGGGERSGSFIYSKGNYGFIKQDTGDADMFVMSGGCVGFGGSFPPPGTRVSYEVVMDAKTGLPRADNVKPEEPVAAVGDGYGAAAPKRSEARAHPYLV